MEKLVSVDLSSFSYGEERILGDMAIDIKKGELVVVSGLSGCGKTTLLRLLNRLIPDLYEGDLQGRIRVLSKDISDYQSGELAKYVGNVFQNPNDQFFSDNVEDEIALVGENLGMDPPILRTRVKTAMDRIGIGDLAGRSVYTLSGGQKQKVAIASSLVYDTALLILDEPSASLDYRAIEELREIIEKLKAEGKTLIIAEHRLYYLTDVLDRLMIMRKGRIEAVFDREMLTEEVQKNYDLRVFKRESLKAERDFKQGDTGIQVKDLQVENKGFKKTYKIHFSLCPGECMGLIGKNGSGKTTLAKQLVGLLPVKEGYTSFGRNKKERLKKSSIVLQHSTNIFFSESVERELIHKDQMKDQDYLMRVKKYLVQMDLWDKKNLNPQDLSGGEKQRLAIIIAMLKESDLLILDEPTSGLDFKRMCLVAENIREYSRKTPCIMITHDLEVLFKSCNTVFILGEDKGRKMVLKGNEEEVLRLLKDL